MWLPPAPLLLPLLGVLLPPGPALGNEGGAMGSCSCERHREAPVIVRRFPERLLFWEICKDFVRFTFKQRRVCGLIGTEWVVDFQNSQPAKRRGASPELAPTDRASPTSLAPRGDSAARDALAETPGLRPTLGAATDVATEGATDPTTDAAPAPATTGRSTPQPSGSEQAVGGQHPREGPSSHQSTHGAHLSTAAQRAGAAGAGPSHFPQQAQQAHNHRVTVISLLLVTLTAVAALVAVVCRRRRRRLGRPPVEPGEELLSVHPAET